MRSGPAPEPAPKSRSASRFPKTRSCLASLTRTASYATPAPPRRCMRGDPDSLHHNRKRPCQHKTLEPPALQLEDIADDLRHRLVEFRRHFLVDLHRRVQAARQGRVLDHRDAVLLGDLADLLRHLVDALG